VREVRGSGRRERTAPAVVARRAWVEAQEHLRVGRVAWQAAGSQEAPEAAAVKVAQGPAASAAREVVAAADQPVRAAVVRAARRVLAVRQAVVRVVAPVPEPAQSRRRAR